MIVKVCGVSTEEIADVAIAAGADRLGLVLDARSPRYVDDRRARALRGHVGNRALVIGVLTQPTVQECQDATERYSLAAVQAHGHLDLRWLTTWAFDIIPALNLGPEVNVDEYSWPANQLILLDAPAAALPGGTGTQVPLEAAAVVARARHIILAGGLGPDNVAEAIRVVRPDGVDASSRLESSPGVKDAALVDAFVRHARAAAAGAVA